MCSLFESDFAKIPMQHMRDPEFDVIAAAIAKDARAAAVEEVAAAAEEPE